MQLKNILATLSLAAAVRAFYIPEGQQDGTYLVRRNADGVEEHIRISRDAAPEADVSPVEGSILEKRTTYVRYCGCGLRMNSGDCDRAVQGVKDQINRAGGNFAVRDKQSIYDIKGSVVAFVCNQSGRTNSVNVDQFTRTLADITNNGCGLYVPGAAYSSDNNLIHGYQNYYNGVDFCGNWAKGTYQHC